MRVQLSMKKITALISGILSLFSFGQPLLLKTGIFLSTSRIVLYSNKVLAEDSLFYFEKGNKKFDANNCLGAIDDFTKAIETNPNFSVAYYNRAMCKGMLGDNNGEISDYDKAIQINPNYLQAYANRGFAKKDSGDLDGACSDWRKVVLLGNKDANQWISYFCR